MDTLHELIAWLYEGKGKVAIHDATNTTRARRDQIMAVLKKHPNFQVLFLESTCDSPTILEANLKMKLEGPDYKGMDPTLALQDFQERIVNYEKAYEPLGDYEDQQGYSYVTLIDVGKKIVASNLHGYLPSQIVFYLMNTHIGERTIWLTRHGESEANVRQQIGGDPSLTPLGREYAATLADFFTQEYGHVTTPIPVWTSTLIRSRETSSLFPSHLFLKRPTHVLNEIHAGLFNDMTYHAVQLKYPNEFLRREANKLYYRYPGVNGESYLDVITRLKPIIIETERLRNDVILISHQGVTRIMLAYYLGIPLQKVPNLVTPLHTLYALKPHPYGTQLVTFKFNPSTHSLEKMDVNDILPAEFLNQS
ncbi:hypothetical protein HMI54_006254 [Coelomomyces lativittatus]|nr:hypothetical protein HMI54_006254 [Coelomomyces lativittatus]KAJ1506289.1 hypothetical protein HMI55_001240 [Coelomomyces lativittatus]